MWNTLEISPNVPRWYEDQVKKSDCVLVLGSHKMTRRCQNTLEEGDDRKCSLIIYFFTNKLNGNNEFSLLVNQVPQVKCRRHSFSVLFSLVHSWHRTESCANTLLCFGRIMHLSGKLPQVLEEGSFK